MSATAEIAEDSAAASGVRRVSLFWLDSFQKKFERNTEKKKKKNKRKKKKKKRKKIS